MVRTPATELIKRHPTTTTPIIAAGYAVKGFLCICLANRRTDHRSRTQKVVQHQATVAASFAFTQQLRANPLKFVPVVGKVHEMVQERQERSALDPEV